MSKALDAQITEYAKSLCDESQWGAVRLIKASIKPSVVLTLCDKDGHLLGVIQGALDIIEERCIEVTA